jgi:hypothetical protein
MNTLPFMGWELPMDVAILCYVLMVLGLCEIGVGSYFAGSGVVKSWKAKVVIFTGLVMIACSIYIANVTITNSIASIEKVQQEVNTDKQTSYVTGDENLMKDSLDLVERQVQEAKNYEWDMNNKIVKASEDMDRENIFKVDIMVNKTYKDLFTIAKSSKLDMFDIHKDASDVSFGELRRYYVTLLNAAPSDTRYMFERKFNTYSVTFFENGTYGMATVICENKDIKLDNMSKGIIVGYTAGAFRVVDRIQPYYVGVFVSEE